MTDQVNADWTELQVTIPAADTDRAGDIAQMVVPYGIYIEDYSHLEEEAMEIAHIDLIDEDLLKKDRTKSIIHVYISPEENPAEAISFLKERFEAVGIENTITAANCAEEDWINNWKKYFKPIPVGNRLLVRPMWEDEYEAGDRVVLHLEPGLAFGTGTHETTRLCMELLEKYVKPGDTMLDMGCGSGILSVAGLLLGAGSAVGVDIDALAVKTAVANAEINHVGDKFTGICGNLADKGNGFFLMDTKFTLLFCNIDLDKNRDGYVLFCRLFFDFFCQMQTVHRMDEFCLSNDIFHFVCLQMSDHMPADIFWKNFHFFTHFLNFILPKITRPKIIYGLKHFDWLGFADSDQCHITAFSSCVFACFAYICFYLLQVFL